MPEHYQACFDIRTQGCVCPLGNRAAAVRKAAPRLLALLREARASIDPRDDDGLTQRIDMEIARLDAIPEKS